MASGTCGKNLTWRFDGGTLTIKGNGDMKNFSDSRPAPWNEHRNAIKKIIVERGVTSIGECAFRKCKILRKAELPDGITSIGERAFSGCALSSINLPVSVASIGKFAFERCNLTAVKIPEGVKSIGQGVFKSCGLRNVELTGFASTFGDNNPFGKNSGTLSLTIHYPAGSGFEKILSDGNSAKLIAYDVQPAKSSTVQPVTSSTVQPAKSSTVQPVKSSTAQPVKSSTVQPAKSSTVQPVKSSTVQPVKSSAAQPVKSSTAQPVKSSTVQPAKSSTVQPAKSSTVQPVTSSTVQPAKSSTVQPVKSSTAQPVKSSTVQPVKSSTVQPVTSSTVQPAKSSTVQPVTSSTVQPAKSSTAQPVTSSTVQPAEKLRRNIDGRTLIVGGVRVIKNFPATEPPQVDSLNILNIIIADGVEEIAAHAFEDCKRLEKVTFPASVKTVGDFAFTICYCGDKRVNGGRNVFWSLDDGILTLKKNPAAKVDSDFSTGFVTWSPLERNITGVKLESGIVPTEKFFAWLMRRMVGRKIFFG